MMSGRAVNKDLTNKDNQLYNAWLQMDFKQADSNGNYKMKQYHQNYGFDLDQVLAKHPIKELGHDEHKSNLLDSLKKATGNLSRSYGMGPNRKITSKPIRSLKPLQSVTATCSGWATDNPKRKNRMKVKAVQ